METMLQDPLAVYPSGVETFCSQISKEISMPRMKFVTATEEQDPEHPASQINERSPVKTL
jgi:hypothetical protein